MVITDFNSTTPYAVVCTCRKPIQTLPTTDINMLNFHSLLIPMSTTYVIKVRDYANLAAAWLGEQT